MHISPELKETVRTHPNIDEVYFSDNGQYYLSIWKDLISGVFFGQFIDGRPVITSRITITAKRKDILGIKSEQEASEQKEEAKEDQISKEKTDKLLYKKHKK